MRSVGGPPSQPASSTSFANFSFQQHHYQQQQQQPPLPSPGGPSYAQPAPFPNSQSSFTFGTNAVANMGPTPFHQYQQQQHQQQQQQGGGIGGGLQQGQFQQHHQQQQHQGQMQGQGLHQQGNNGNVNHGPGSQGSDGSGNGGPHGQPGFGPGSTAGASGNGNGAGPNAPEYTLAGILHYLQSEWRRYERDRNEWEIERAEMRARIALLEGERRGAENLKTDLMRRVKMLEFALRQERSKYLAQSSGAAGSTAGAPTGSPGQTMGTGSPAVGGPPGGLAKHPLIQGVSADKASSSGRSSPVARSEDLGKDGGFGAASATFQAHPLRGPSNLATSSFTASSLTFNGLPSAGAGSTMLFNPAAGAGSTMSFNAATAPNASMLSRHTSLARDGKSRAKSRDYLKQCLSEIAYLTNPATINPLNERAYISGAVSFPPGQGPSQPNGSGAGGAPGALGLASLGAGAASIPGQQQSPTVQGPSGILRPRKVMYDDVGAGGTPPPLLPPPPPPSLPTQSLPTQQGGQSAPSGHDAGFVAQGGGLDRSAETTDPGLPNFSGATDPLGAGMASNNTSEPLGGQQPEAHALAVNEANRETAPAPPMEDAAELLPAPSPSGATPVVPDVPAPTPQADAAGTVTADDASSTSSEGDDDGGSDRSSTSSSTTVDESGERGAEAGAIKAGSADTAPITTAAVDDKASSECQPFFEQRSGGAASGPDRMSLDSDGRPPSSSLAGHAEVERDIDDEVDEEDDVVEPEQRTAIYRPGGVASSASEGAGAGSGSIASATADDWRRLREAGAQQRQRREQERLARQASEGAAAAAADTLADARAHLAETTERVNALLASERSVDVATASKPRPNLVRTSSGRADEDALANLKLDPVPDDDVGVPERRRARAGSALSAATSSEPVADTQPWKAKRVLRGHLDAVRAVAFDTVEMSVLSAGDDCTIKYWRFDPASLQGGSGNSSSGTRPREGSFSSLRAGATGSIGGAGAAAGGNSAADYPIVTFRGHTEAVTCLAVSPPLVGSGDGSRRIYSGSLDASIRVWPAPDTNTTEAYPPVEQTLELGTLVGHTDAVWDLALFPHLNLLVSVAADGMVKVWSTTNGVASTSASMGDDEDKASAQGAKSAGSVGSLNLSWDYFGTESDDSAADDAGRAAFLEKAKAVASDAGSIRNGGLPVPTSVDVCHSNIRLCAVGYTNAVVKLFDVTTGKAVMTLQSEDTKDASPDVQINCVVTHPTLPILFTAHEDGHIRMFDLNTGACTMAMVGHLDSVTTLDIDPAGLTLVSGGHDCSVRFWDIMGGGTAAPSSSDGAAQDKDKASSTSSSTAAAAAAAVVSVRDSCVQEITSHRKKAEEGVLGVKYHASASFFASAGADGLVRLFG